MVTIRVKSGGSRRLYFEIGGNDGRPLATSVAFDTICRLEAALQRLQQAAQAPHRSVVRLDVHSVEVRGNRLGPLVRLEGSIPDDAWRALLDDLPKAVVIDERPRGRRRTDLTGRLCDLQH